MQLGLKQRLREKEEKDREAALARYRIILTKGDAARDDEARELEEIMETLGFGSAKVAADIDAIQLRIRLRKVADGFDAANNGMIDARNRHAAWVAEADRIFRETEEKTKAVLAEKHAAETAQGACNNARRKLMELEAANMELFAVDASDLNERMRNHLGGQPDIHLGPRPE